MRIIGGRLKGKTILPPAGYKARPTTDFAREGLFNVLDNEYEFEDLKVLDLFGGTGAISFEFASRGASRVYCVEMARENASFIKTEAQRLGLTNVTMVRDNVFDFLPICREKFDIWRTWTPFRTRSSRRTSSIPAVTSSWSTAGSTPSGSTPASRRRRCTAVCISPFSNKRKPSIL